MAVRDHGLEALRKSAEEVIPGDKAEYKLRVFGEVETIAPAKAASAVKTNVAAATSNTPLLAANASRQGFKLFNDSNSAVFVNFGDAADASNFVVKMGPNAFYETNDFTGAVNALWVSANGAMRVTEL